MSLLEFTVELIAQTLDLLDLERLPTTLRQPWRARISAAYIS
jgi:hypothetical protein